jgi:hypothetical protein
MSTTAGYAHREVTHPPNWHELVVVDVVLNAATTGLFLVTAAGELARPDVFGPVAACAYPLALVLLLADLMCLVLDLGDPRRFHHMLRVFKPSSPMSLGTWCLTAYSLPLSAVAALDVLALLGWLPVAWTGPAPARAALVLLAVPFAFGSMAYKGVLFSTSAQPGWRDARWLGAYHTTSALAVGAGLLWALAELGGHDRAASLLRPALAVLVVVSAYPAWRLAVELCPAAAGAYTAGERLAAGAAVLAGGIVAPAALTAVGGVAAAVVAAAALLGGAYAARAVVVALPHRTAAPVGVPTPPAGRSAWSAPP